MKYFLRRALAISLILLLLLPLTACDLDGLLGIGKDKKISEVPVKHAACNEQGVVVVTYQDGYTLTLDKPEKIAVVIAIPFDFSITGITGSSAAAQTSEPSVYWIGNAPLSLLYDYNAMPDSILQPNIVTADEDVKVELLPSPEISAVMIQRNSIQDYTELTDPMDALYLGAFRVKKTCYASCISNVEALCREQIRNLTVPLLPVLGDADTPDRIADGGFADCTNLVTVTVSEGYRTLGEGAFRGCSELRLLVLPASLEFIEKDAFFGCQIDRLVLGKGLRLVSAGLFDGTVDHLLFQGSAEEWNAMDLRDTEGNPLPTENLYFFSEQPVNDPDAALWFYLDGVPTLPQDVTRDPS